MLLVSLLSLRDRNALAILAPTILHETHLSGEQYGIIIACFSWAYMLGNPLWGYLLDHVGVRRGMTIAVGIWTVASTAHAWATGFWSFAAVRAVLGAGEGATFPAVSAPSPKLSRPPNEAADSPSPTAAVPSEP